MAIGDVFSQFGGSLFENLFGSILWFGLAIFFIGVLGFLMWYFLIYKKKFDIDVKITSERSGDRNRIIFDRAAILKDRVTGTKFFKVWSLKIELPIPEFSVLQTSNKGDYLELYRTSEDHIYFLTPARIDKFKLIKADGKVYPLASQENRQIDTDLAYWNVKRKNQNKKMFDTEGWLSKLLPHIPAIIGGVLTIFVLYVLMDNLPGILRELTELTKELRSLKGATVVTSGYVLPFILRWKRK